MGPMDPLSRQGSGRTGVFPEGTLTMVQGKKYAPPPRRVAYRRGRASRRGVGGGMAQGTGL
jgi:hypothetical protein